MFVLECCVTMRYPESLSYLSFVIRAQHSQGHCVCVSFIVIVLYLKLCHDLNVSTWDGYDPIINTVTFQESHNLFTNGIHVMEIHQAQCI